MKTDVPITLLAVAVAACGGQGGSGGDEDPGFVYDVVIKSDAHDPGHAWDPGKHQDPGQPEDLGQAQDSGDQDSGAADVSPVDPGQEVPADTFVDPGSDAGSDVATDVSADTDGDPGPDQSGDAYAPDASIDSGNVDAPDHGSADGGGQDPGIGDPGFADPGTDTHSTDQDTAPVDVTCQGFYDCAASCPDGDQTCIDACAAQMSPEGAQEQQALETCLAANGCFGLTGDAFEACLDANCLDQYFQCFSGGDLGTCVELNACLGACPDGDSACSSSCFTSATYEANWDHQHLHDCLVTACGEIPPDTDVNGYQAWLDCANVAILVECADNGVKCVESGQLYPTCADLVDCLVGCPDDDPLTPDVDEGQECVNACFDGASFDANSKYEIRRQCLLGQCPICEVEDPTPEQDQQCADCLNTAAADQCKAEAKACQATGANPCGQVWDCVYQCTTSECVQACYASGTSTAQDLYDALVACLETACPDMFKTCVDAAVQNECLPQDVACQSDT